MGHIGMQTVSEKLLDNSDRTVIGLGDVPEVCEPFCVAMSRVPLSKGETTDDLCQ